MLDLMEFVFIAVLKYVLIGTDTGIQWFAKTSHQYERAIISWENKTLDPSTFRISFMLAMANHFM